MTVRINVKTKTFGSVEVKHDGYVVTVTVPEADVTRIVSARFRFVSTAGDEFHGIRSEAKAIEWMVRRPVVDRKAA